MKLHQPHAKNAPKRRYNANRGYFMSNKNAKKLRKEVRNAGNAIYDTIKRQVNALKLRYRFKIAFRILRGAW